MITVLFVLVPFLLIGHWSDPNVSALIRSSSSTGRAFLLVATSLSMDPVAPIPSSVVTVLSGAMLGLPLGTVAAWWGMTLGSALGYGIGSGVFARWTRPKPSPDAQDGKVLSPATLGAVAATRGVPVLAEAVTLLAGAHRLPFLPFMAVSAIANLGVAAAYAYVGAMAANVNSFLLAFGGSIGLPAIALLLHRVVTRRRRGR